jgi:hypothetical protein
MGVHLRHLLLAVVVPLMLSIIGGTDLTTTARASVCPNEGLREREAYASRLPDCRAYEQVSPTSKGNADALGAPGFVQASPSGEDVTFFSLSPFPMAVVGSAEFPTYLSTRTTKWSTQGLLPPTAPGGFSGVAALTDDLSKTIVLDYPPLPPETTIGQSNYYLRDNNTGTFQMFAPVGQIYFADSTQRGSRILFESSEPLLSNAAPGVTNLYEWNNGQLSVVGILPGGGVAKGGSVAGAGASAEHYTEHTISEDGSRVFFTDLKDGHIYVRENGEGTVPVSAGSGHFRAATPNGRYVFYTDETGELWRFDVDTHLSEAVASGLGIIGVLGVSNDGTYAYFVDQSHKLYEWHAGSGSPIFIAELTSALEPGIEGARGDEDDWVDAIQGIGGGPAGGGRKSSRVTPDGRTVLFFKGASLFLYNASSGKLLQVAKDARLGRNELEMNVSPSRNPFLTRNLSEDGHHIFFETEEALVPRDTNGVMDVYEWVEETSGGCERSNPNFYESPDGCIYLISSGQSSTPSYFGDASEDGNDLFFFTRQSLVGQDQDQNVDIYDARVDGGIAAQNSSSPALCVGDSCLNPASSREAFGEPPSATFSGNGNLTLPLSKPTTSMTRVQRLARELSRCRKKPKTRSICIAKVKRKYGVKHKAKKTTESSHTETSSS